MYFSKFPTIPFLVSGKRFKTASEYVAAVDITAAARLLRGVLPSITTYDSYFVSDGETPEIIAEKIWNRKEWHWIILLLNDIFHPADFPMAESDLFSMIRIKYGTPELDYADGEEIAKETVARYINEDGIAVLPEPIDVSGTTIYPCYEFKDTVGFPTVKWVYEDGTPAPKPLIAFDIEGLTASSVFNYEIQLNDAKREIKVVSAEAADYIATQYTLAMGV